MAHTAADYLARGVRVERTRRDWRQVDLAERLGWSQTRVAAVEGGRRTLDITAIVELCRAFGVPLGKLLEDANPDDRRALGLE